MLRKIAPVAWESNPLITRFRLGSTTIPAGPVLIEPPCSEKNLIRLAVVDFLTSAAGPWGHELMVPFCLPCPHRYGSFEPLPGS